MVAIDGPSNVDLGVKTTLTSLWSLLFSKKKIPFQLLIKGIRSFSPENEVKRIILFPFFFFVFFGVSRGVSGRKKKGRKKLNNNNNKQKNSIKTSKDVITFYKPLTLIVGSNGAGKTVREKKLEMKKKKMKM